MKTIICDDTVHGQEYVLRSEAEEEIKAAVAAERERCGLTHDQVAALKIMLDHYQGDPRTECLMPLVRDAIRGETL